MKKMIFAAMIAAGLMTTSFVNAQTAEKKSVKQQTKTATKKATAMKSNEAIPQSGKEKTAGKADGTKGKGKTNIKTEKGK
jgi:hypothetical protein